MIPAKPLTPLESSAANTGRRHFACSEPVYNALCQQIDAAREFPAGVGTAAPTVRSLPLPAGLPTDAQGRVLISVELWRMTPGDDALLGPAIAAGYVIELTAAEYAAALPPSEPFPIDSVN